MDLLIGEKRKNDEPRRRVPVWVLLAAAFAVGVILTLLLFNGGSNSSAVYVYGDESVWVTATRVVEQATNMAQGVFFEANNAQQAAAVDPLQMTATYIIQGATATAQAAGS